MDFKIIVKGVYKSTLEFERSTLAGSNLLLAELLTELFTHGTFVSYNLVDVPMEIVIKCKNHNTGKFAQISKVVLI